MTVCEMCEKYYPTLWDIRRMDALKAAGKITDKEYKAVVDKKK